MTVPRLKAGADQFTAPRQDFFQRLPGACYQAVASRPYPVPDLQAF
jgi:hypothetical protein